MESVSDYAVLVLGPAGHVLGWNRGAQRLLGYRPEEIRWEHLRRLFFRPEEVERGEPEHELWTAEALGQALRGRWYVRRDGTALWCGGVTVALRDGAGRLRAFAKVLGDLTGQVLSGEPGQPREVASATFAREVRHLLLAIQGCREVLLRKLGLGDPTSTAPDAHYRLHTRHAQDGVPRPAGIEQRRSGDAPEAE
jgi:PAS domain S-box-containing protein